MAEYVTKIRTSQGDMQIDYAALANLPDLTVYATKTEVAAVSTDYTVTIPATGWAKGTNGAYSISVTVNGIKADDTPIIDLNTASLYTNQTTYENTVDAFSKIVYIETGTNLIKCYTSVGATSAPAVAIPIKIKVVR